VRGQGLPRYADKRAGACLHSVRADASVAASDDSDASGEVRHVFRSPGSLGRERLRKHRHV
jgi:hypothetical protein